MQQRPALDRHRCRSGLTRALLRNSGKADATDAEVTAAAERAFAHDFIMNKTKDQYDTEVRRLTP